MVIGTGANAQGYLTLSKAGAEQREIFIGNASDLNTEQHYNRTSSQYVDNRIIANTHQFYSGGSEIARITGSGITFNGDTAAANALDDYEEGTWNPDLGGSVTGGSFTTSTSAGHYTKIGRLVTVGWLIIVNGVTTQPTGNIIIQNLPFSVGGTGVQSYSNVGTVLYNDVFNNDIGSCYVQSNFVYFAPAGVTQANANFSSVTLSTGYFSGSMTYTTA